MKEYNVIYADPPWDQKGGPEFRTNGKSEPLPYPTMTVQDICSLPVQSITAKDAHLYIWATNQYLESAFEVIREWGFRYSTTIVWEKAAMGTGLGGAHTITTEFLLFARKGSLKAKQRNIGTCYRVKRPYVNGAPCHSKKPLFFTKLIENTSPGDRIELFARQQRGSWDVWGNEVECDIDLMALA